MTDNELEEILLDPGVIRNRLKIYSVRKNAQVALQIQREFGSLDQYFWYTPFAKGDKGDLVSGKNPQSLRDSSFAKELTNSTIIHHGATIYDFPTEDIVSQMISKDLKKRGMSFVGSTIIYAFMQATGMVDDHIDGCFCKK
jgi:DNA-3-methyladenine glycosylase I